MPRCRAVFRYPPEAGPEATRPTTVVLMHPEGVGEPPHLEIGEAAYENEARDLLRRMGARTPRDLSSYATQGFRRVNGKRMCHSFDFDGTPEELEQAFRKAFPLQIVPTLSFEIPDGFPGAGYDVTLVPRPEGRRGAKGPYLYVGCQAFPLAYWESDRAVRFILDQAGPDVDRIERGVALLDATLKWVQRVLAGMTGAVIEIDEAPEVSAAGRKRLRQARRAVTEEASCRFCAVRGCDETCRDADLDGSAVCNDCGHRWCECDDDL